MEFPISAARCARAAAALALCISAATAVAAKPQWTVTDITPNSGFGGAARGLNNRGDVISQTFVRGPSGFFVSQAVLWQDGTNYFLSSLGTSTIPEAINDKGTIAINADGRMYSWDSGVATPLYFAGDVSGINKSGDVSGHYFSGGTTGSGRDHALLDRNGVLTDLGTLGGIYSGAAGINDKDVIVGSSWLAMSSNYLAFIWQDGVMRQLPGLGGTTSSAFGINNHGEIIGYATEANGRQWMVRWTDASLPPEELMVRGAAHSINDKGDIVGNNLDTGKPFLLERDGTLTWLMDLPVMQAGGWQSFNAVAINERGWIVGTAWKPGGPSFGSVLVLMPK